MIKITPNAFSISHRRPICGVGINDADYMVCPRTEKGRVSCKFYKVWRSMIERCYSPNVQKRQPSYIGCSVVEEWHRFMNFREWMIKQDWKGNQLDKDILVVGNKIYSPETCAFVSQQTNLLLLSSLAPKNEWPIGVSEYKKTKRFIARCKNGSSKLIYLGTFPSPEAASFAYRKFKSNLIRKAALEQSDERVCSALLARAVALEEKS